MIPNLTPSPAETSIRSRYRRAAQHAKKAYPGPVGELISRELYSWEEFAYRFGGEGFMERVVEQVLNMPIVETEEAA